ncbi:MAG: cupin domain-containing protein [Spirochaetes bacterium]|nr:cupin domain-containing protein [Spirochaetota bacterium]
MLIKHKDMIKEIKKEMRGGQGEITITHIAMKDTLVHARLMAYINIPVGASIGNHQHVKEIEYYVIIKGTGIVTEDGVEMTVKEKDVVLTGGGSTHSIRNEGKEELEMIAVIILE